MPRPPLRFLDDPRRRRDPAGDRAARRRRDARLRDRARGGRRHDGAPARGASMTTLRFGYSPCPNDTFAFHALAHGLVDAPFRVEPVVADIEELNLRARAGELELTKLSYGAFPAVGDRYRLLRSGA